MEKSEKQAKIVFKKLFTGANSVFYSDEKLAKHF